MEGNHKPFIPQVNPWLGEAERDAVARVVESGWLTEGQETESFARELLAVTGAPFGVFAPNGTLALAMAMMALGIGEGDEILIPNITFVGSATATVLAGASPVFVDVEPRFFQIDLEAAERAVTAKTRAIMPVHLYGTMCDMEAVGAFAGRHGLLVIEDAAQALGVSQGGRHAGTFGEAGAFSFFADKTITTGEGGFVVCRDAETHDRLLRLRNQGRLRSGSFVHETVGYNFRITDLQAALGRAQLGRLDSIIAAKLEHHLAYSRTLAAVPEARVLGPAPFASFVPFRCVLIAERAHELMAHLERASIQPRGVFLPLHRQPCFAGLPSAAADFPISEQAHGGGVCLPIYPTLTTDEIHRIAGEIAEFYEA